MAAAAAAAVVAAGKPALVTSSVKQRAEGVVPAPHARFQGGASGSTGFVGFCGACACRVMQGRPREDAYNERGRGCNAGGLWG